MMMGMPTNTNHIPEPVNDVTAIAMIAMPTKTAQPRNVIVDSLRLLAPLML